MSGLARSPGEHVPQDEDRPLSRRQELDRDQERQADAFPLRVSRFGVGSHTGDHRVGQGLEPSRIRHRWCERPAGIRGPVSDGWQDPACPLSQKIQTGVGRDFIQPRPKWSPSFKRVQALPGSQEGLLDHVLGLFDGSEHPITVNVQLSPVRLGQLTERISITGAGPLDQG